MAGSARTDEADLVHVLVVNAGSSSLKLRLLDNTQHLQASDDLPPIADDELENALGRFLSAAPEVEAAGHRVVHGGSDFREAVRLDDAIDDRLDQLCDVAPLHNPPSVAAIRAMQRLRPDLPQVACFDTAFHATLADEAAVYAVPWEWTRRWELRRYGFHGLSHSWASRRAAELLGDQPGGLRLVTAHLGSGASLAAVVGGRSVDTTMGFTPLDGLVMSTRSGGLDPGMVLWLHEHGGLAPDAIEQALEHESGLLGVSGRSGDLRVVLDAADDGDDRARLAYGIYLHRLRALIASMAAAMGGIDGLVFTGGAGENSGRLRADACRGLEFLGVALDDTANEQHDGPPDRLVSPAGAAVAVAVIRAREDVEIARQVGEVLGWPGT